MTAQTMSSRYELASKGHSTEKAQELVTQQNNICCFIGLTFMLYLKLSFLQLSMLLLESTLEYTFSVFDKQHIYYMEI